MDKNKLVDIALTIFVIFLFLGVPAVLILIAAQLLSGVLLGIVATVIVIIPLAIIFLAWLGGKMFQF
jgi:hypothetical protein